MQVTSIAGNKYYEDVTESTSKPYYFLIEIDHYVGTYLH